MSGRQLAVVMIASLLSAVLGVAATLFFLSPTPESFSEHPAPSVRRAVPPDAPNDFIAAAERSIPAVASVRSYDAAGLSSTGSAVIISPDGYVATNNHVVSGASRVRVTLTDRREFDAKVLGTDRTTDLALLRIDADDLPHLSFGDSDSVRVGEWVVAVGNPFNLRSTVTAGIVSAKGRSIDVLEGEDRIESFIQTDAAINPGNSGGALVSGSGDLIGINTAIITNSGRHEGFAFAIPGNLARRVLADLRQYGEVKRAVLGVWIQGLNDAQAKRLGLDEARGARVTDLTPGGPAERAGLKINDVLVKINDVAINSSSELQEQLSRYRPGESVELIIVRNNRERSLDVLLRDKKNRARALVSARPFGELVDRLGFTLDGLEVIEVAPDGPAAEANLTPGFQIISINGRSINDAAQLRATVVEELDRGLLLGGLYPGVEGEYFYRLE